MGVIEIESAFDDFELFKVPIKLSESSAARDNKKPQHHCTSAIRNRT